MQVTTPLPPLINAGTAPRRNALERLTFEHALWAAMCGLALLARAWMLDAIPLNSAEANAANAALAVARGGSATLLNPLHGGLQAALFALLGANEFSARLVAAIAGAALCLTPMAFRDQLGRRAALIMASLMIFSPTLWYVARLADGATLAWAIAMLTWAMLRRGRATGTAVGLGLLVASGIDGAIPLIFLAAIALITRPAGLGGLLSARSGLVAFAALALGATTGLWNLSGMGDALQGLASFAVGILRPGILPYWRAMLGFGLYESLIIAGALVELIRWQINTAMERRFGLDGRAHDENTAGHRDWLVVVVAGLAIVLLDQSRDVHHLIPLTLACAALTALLADRILSALPREGSWTREGVAAGLSLVFLFVADIGVRQYAGQGDTKWLLLAIVAVFIVAAGGIALSLRMSGAAVARGIAIAAWVILSVGTFGAGFSLTQSHAANPGEPYVTESIAVEARAMQGAIEQVALLAYGDKTVMPIDVHDTAPSWLRWLLRDQKFASYAPRPANAAAALLPATLAFNSEFTYVSNSLEVTQRNGLGGVRCKQAADRQDCQAVARWLVLRDGGPPFVSSWTLYVRQDIAQRASGQTWPK
ncbi:MAG: hypothetical protein KA750_12495 [Thermoflexales bacterium]|nr:hypothetical protein [Thermoflexales bacterium]